MCNADVPRIGPRMILVLRHSVADWRLWLAWLTASYAFPTTERAKGAPPRTHERCPPQPSGTCHPLSHHLGRWVARDGNLDKVAAATWELELDIVVFGPIRAKD